MRAWQRMAWPLRIGLYGVALLGLMGLFRLAGVLRFRALWMQVREGLKNGDQVVTYSEKALTARSRIHVVDHIPGVSR